MNSRSNYANSNLRTSKCRKSTHFEVGMESFILKLKKIMFLSIQFFIMHSNSRIVWKCVDQKSTNVTFSKKYWKICTIRLKNSRQLTSRTQSKLDGMLRKRGLIWSIFVNFLPTNEILAHFLLLVRSRVFVFGALFLASSVLCH